MSERSCRKCGVLFNKRNCPACNKVYIAAWKKDNPDKERPKRNCKKCGVEFDGPRCRPCNRKAVLGWAKKNPEKIKITQKIGQSKRRARKLKIGGSISNDLPGKLFNLQKGKCACCGELLGDDFHMDHIMPLALGGSNTDNNIQLLRKECNLIKNAKHPVDFMQSKGFLL